jgi:hypothetical protein
VLPGPRVTTAPCCLALPHLASAHRAPLSPSPTRQPLEPAPLASRRPPLSRSNAASAPVGWGSMLAFRAVLRHAWAPSFFPFPPSMRRPPPDPLPPSFPLYRRLVPLFAPLLRTRAQARRCLPRPPLTWSVGLRCQDHRGP